MINNRKIYDIKIYNDELIIIIAILHERIRQLRSILETKEDSIERDMIKSSINQYLTIVSRLDTGAMYNDNNYGKCVTDDNFDFKTDFTEESLENN